METEVVSRFLKYRPFWRSFLCSILLTIIIIYCLAIRAEKYKILQDISANSLKYVYHEEMPSKILNSSEAKRLINEYNQAETILNLEDFGEMKNNTVIIVISVIELHEPLKYLIASLCDLNGIEDTLLVFSHLVFDEKLNHFIQSINCCRVLQIFYPYSLQIYKDEFPGYDKNYCPLNMKKGVQPMNCTPADIYGKYRKPLEAQKKHYWWWTANRIFEHLLSTFGHNGLVVFLEDDIFILSDFLYMLLYMHKLAKSMPQCEFIHLGYHEWSLENKTYHVDLTSWDPKEHTSVLAFDVPVWNIILENYDLFCNFDDSSWSRSLYHISLNRKDNGRFKVVYTTIPRAIKITCFFNGFYENCNVMDNVIQALRTQRFLKINLFPPYLEVYTHIELEEEDFAYIDMLEGEGSWTDPRDRALCVVNITKNKIKKLFAEMKLDLSHS